MSKVMTIRSIFTLKRWASFCAARLPRPLSVCVLIVLSYGFYDTYQEVGVIKTASDLFSTPGGRTLVADTLIVWLLFNMILAALDTFKESKTLGFWSGARFTYHASKPVFTTTVGPQDDGTLISFRIPGAVSGTVATLRIACDAGGAMISATDTRLITAMARRDQHIKKTVNPRKEFSFSVSCPADADPTIVQVYLLYFEKM